MFHECRHIKSDGHRCHGAALRGKAYCYFHMNLRRMHSPNPAESQHFQLPPIEDTASVLIALGQVIRTLDSPYADIRRAGLMLQALQIAAKLTAHRENSHPEKLVRTLYNPAGETIDFSAALDHGIDMLAPDKTVCEPPEDCRHCPQQDTCDNYEEPEEEEEEEDEAGRRRGTGRRRGREREEEENEEEEEKDEEDVESDENHEDALIQLKSPCHSDRPESRIRLATGTFVGVQKEQRKPAVLSATARLAKSNVLKKQRAATNAPDRTRHARGGRART